MEQNIRTSGVTRLSWLAKSVGIAAVYFTVGKLTLSLEIPPSYVSALWPPAGIALGGTLLFGYRVWPGVFAGAFLVVVSTPFDQTSLVTVLKSVAGSGGVAGAIAGGAALQAVLGAYLVRRFVGFPSNFEHLRRVIGTMVLGGPVACLTSATVASASLFLAGAIEAANLAQTWGTWFMADSIGVLLVIPLASAWGAELHRSSRRTRLFVSLPVLAAVAITLIGYLEARDGDLERAHAEFARRAEIMARTLEQVVLAEIEIIESAVSLMEFGGEVNHSDFQAFVKPALARHPEFRGLGWIALVPGDRRAAVEEAVRRGPYSDFQITERSAEGTLVRARERDEYAVVFYLEPYEGNEEALGFDLMSDPDRASALARARDSGQIIATPPIKLVQKTDSEMGFLIFAPIYNKGLPHHTLDGRRRNLHSFVSAVFSGKQLVDHALRAFQGEGLDVSVIDISDPRDARHHYGDRTSIDDRAAPATTLAWSTDLEIAGRRWTLRFRPSSTYISIAPETRIGVVLTGGLFFTSLLGAFLLVVAGRASATERSNEELRREVRERLRTEAALSLREKALLYTQFTVDHAVDAIFWVEQDASFSYVNEAACKMVGYSREQLLSMRVFDIDSNYSAEMWPDFWREAQAAGSLVIETQMRRHDATEFPSEIALNYLEEDGVERLFATARDTTERKKALEERLALEAKVQQTQKLESLGVLAGGIAHDFNNLLVGVLGNAELSLAALAPDAPARDYVQDIEFSAERAADLANQLLAYSGKGKFVVEPIDLSDLVKEIAQLVEVTVSKKSAIKYDLASNLPSVECDATQVRQVVLNLITNSSEALGENPGLVSVTTGLMQCDADYLGQMIAAKELPGGAYVFVEVGDTGTGMDAHTITKIFDPFYTTKFTGRGLGLAAVLGIVRGHNGAIQVQSEPGGGARIRVFFPASARAAVESPASEEREDAWKGDGVVLLVDDESVVRTVSSRMLTLLGFDVLTAMDGEEALKVYRAHADDIVVVLLDLAMPRMGGEETFTKLRSIKEDVKVILCSGYDEQETTSKFSGRGLAGFIQKPYRLDVLAERIREVLEA